MAVSASATVYRLFAARPGSGPLVDGAIAAAALAGSLSQLAHGDPVAQSSAGGLDGTSALLAACSTLPLLAWRRAPGVVFALTASATALLGGFGYPTTLPLGPAAALYLLAASRDEQHPWTWRSTAGALGLFLAYILAVGVGGGGFPTSEVLHSGLAWAVAWFAGERTRLRREHLAELRERAKRAERDAERERHLAVAEERARIARDLHDAAGHAINVIAVRAGTARLRRDPNRSQAALEAIEELARRTAADIDQIVGALRERGDAGEPVAPPPGLASLDTLVAGCAAAGLEVSVATAGTQRPLEPALDQGAYRILQEALTNAARHGAGAARVDLAFAEASLELSVSNPAARNGSPRSSGGHGLIGMRERASLLGGRVDVERADGVFRVRARLPYGGHAT